MYRGLASILLLTLTLALPEVRASVCFRLMSEPHVFPPFEWARQKIVDQTLNLMAKRNGLPRYLELNKFLRETGFYDGYANFGEMGLAEMGISVRYNSAALAAMDTGRPLIVVANHHLGIADGLALQYLAGKARSRPSLLYLARWIEEILPHAVYVEGQPWGTAIPVEINGPKKSDPEYDKKMAAVKAFNAPWTRPALKNLKNNGALLIFPAGHVASMNPGGRYPANVFDEENSWQEGFLSLARLGKADIVFAHVDAVNSEAFYRDRKRFGGGDKERVIWFFSEALAKAGQAVDVRFSQPMRLDDVYTSLSNTFGRSQSELHGDPKLTAELMRRFVYELPNIYPQTLDVTDLPPVKRSVIIKGRTPSDLLRTSNAK